MSCQSAPGGKKLGFWVFSCRGSVQPGGQPVNNTHVSHLPARTCCFVFLCTAQKHKAACVPSKK
ncbi:unnamed protein product, partial [Staurois parvus]